MNRRYLLVLTTCAALLPLTAAAQTEVDLLKREVLQATLSDRSARDRMLLSVDTLRYTLTLSVFESSETMASLAKGRDSYLSVREGILTNSQKLADDLAAIPDGALQLSDAAEQDVRDLEAVAVEAGIAPGSTLSREMFTGLRYFLKSAEISGVDADAWLCGTFPFSVACN